MFARRGFSVGQASLLVSLSADERSEFEEGDLGGVGELDLFVERFGL